MHVHAEVLQHALHRLLGERRVAERVAGAAQAHDEAIADQLAVAGTAEHGNVLDARRRGRGCGET